MLGRAAARLFAGSTRAGRVGGFARGDGPAMTGGKIDAFLALRSREGRLLVGRERVRLLEVVAELGSITTAARATGISYKTV